MTIHEYNVMKFIAQKVFTDFNLILKKKVYYSSMMPPLAAQIRVWDNLPVSLETA
jgi:hypothetical protein